jgi:N-acetylglucosamine malate deacetylase 1
MIKIILCVSPHPDDETLGCGGTLLRHIAEGGHVHWLIMTKISEEAGYSSERIESRSDEIKRVSESFGFLSIHQAPFTTTRLDTYPKSDLVNEVSRYMLKVKPDTIYLPYRNDVHSDHEAVFDAVVSCSKSFRYPFVKRLRAYETLSETEFSIRPDRNGFIPNLWVDISQYVDRKIEIMKIYKSELGEHPFPRSEKNLRALAILRGSTAGVEAAEGFVSLKEVV